LFHVVSGYIRSFGPAVGTMCNASGITWSGSSMAESVTESAASEMPASEHRKQIRRGPVLRHNRIAMKVALHQLAFWEVKRPLEPRAWTCAYTGRFNLKFRIASRYWERN
jgi:hypothetical protein